MPPKSPADSLAELYAADLQEHATVPSVGTAEYDALRARDRDRRGHPEARWLAAAAYDRSCMYEGRPQRLGTQFVPDGVRYRLWDVESTTTDAERAEWDVPTLATQLARAEEMSRTEPQPPMDQAPGWLRGAIECWRRTSSAWR